MSERNLDMHLPDARSFSGVFFLSLFFVMFATEGMETPGAVAWKKIQKKAGIHETAPNPGDQLDCKFSSFRELICQDFGLSKQKWDGLLEYLYGHIEKFHLALLTHTVTNVPILRYGDTNRSAFLLPDVVDRKGLVLSFLTDIFNLQDLRFCFEQDSYSESYNPVAYIQLPAYICQKYGVSLIYNRMSDGKYSFTSEIRVPVAADGPRILPTVHPADPKHHFRELSESDLPVAATSTAAYHEVPSSSRLLPKHSLDIARDVAEMRSQMQALRERIIEVQKENEKLIAVHETNDRLKKQLQSLQAELSQKRSVEDSRSTREKEKLRQQVLEYQQLCARSGLEIEGLKSELSAKDQQIELAKESCEKLEERLQCFVMEKDEQVRVLQEQADARLQSEMDAMMMEKERQLKQQRDEIERLIRENEELRFVVKPSEVAMSTQQISPPPIRSTHREEPALPKITPKSVVLLHTSGAPVVSSFHTLLQKQSINEAESQKVRRSASQASLEMGQQQDPNSQISASIMRVIVYSLNKGQVFSEKYMDFLKAVDRFACEITKDNYNTVVELFRRAEIENEDLRTALINNVYFSEL